MTEEKGKEELLFQVDPEIKEEFLSRYVKSTRKSYSSVLQKSDEFEAEINKKVYNLNIEERDELLVIKYKNKTKKVVETNISILRNYVDFCISKNVVKHMENRFATILPSSYQEYVNVQATKNFYLSKDEIRELEDKLVNAQDKLILELLGVWGIRGRTEKGNTCEELCNLKKENISWKYNRLDVVNNDDELRYVEVDEHTMQLLQNTIDQTFYIFNNGKNDEKTKKGFDRGFDIESSEYVFRLAGRRNDNRVDAQFFTRRVVNIRKWLGKNHLTISNLYFSSMITYAKEQYAKKGELTKEDYIEINRIFNYGNTKDRWELYWAKTQAMIKPYLK